MMTITKVFRFEMGHAIDGYGGMCKYLHGHSYQLHITVTKDINENKPIEAPGFVVDFKELKRLVKENIVNQLDHALMLSENYLKNNPNAGKGQNLIVLPYEPSAENILYYIRKKLNNSLNGEFKLVRMKLWETPESYAEWENFD